MFSRGLLRQAGDVYKAGTAWFIALAWPACLFMAVFSPVIMRLFGKEFVAGATTLIILAVAMLVNTGCGSCGVVLSMTGRTVANLTIAFVAAAADVGGNFLLVPHLGMRGAAHRLGRRHGHRQRRDLDVLVKQFGLHPFGRATIRVGFFAVLCFGLFGVVVRLALGPTFAGAYVAGAVGTAAYCALVWRWRHELGLSSGKAFIAPVLSTCRAGMSGAPEALLGARR